VLRKGEARQFIFTVGVVLCEGLLVAASQSTKAAAPLTGWPMKCTEHCPDLLVSGAAA